MSWTDEYYTPFLELGKDIARQSMPRPNHEATTGVPNPQRDDPYPRFSPWASWKREAGAVSFAEREGREPQTAEELELASGVDRRIPDAPRTWGEPTKIPSLGAYATAPGGGYALAHGTPPPVRKITPDIPFQNTPGESFADTAARGARMQAEQDRLGLTTADMDYIRSYGRKAWEDRNAKYAPPSTREDYLRRQQGNLAASVAERQAAGRELADIERENEAQRRREMWAAEQAARLEGARIAASAPVSFGAGAGAVQNADGGWDVSRPEPAPAAPPAPVSFGGGAGAIPEIGEDGRPTGRYVYQSPPTPSADTDRPVALGGGGMGVKDPATGEWTIKIPPKQGEKGARAVTLKPGESYYDPETKETYVAPGADRQSIEAEIANLTAALGKAFEQNAIAAIERQLADARARLAALGAPAPAPGGASSPSEPQPAPATAQPAPAPAQPAASSSPTGHRRWTPGA